jgi:SMI1-KNR4 cell-wall/A nuclease of the HNH/ENDO VII superfamily with conserved WHH
MPADKAVVQIGLSGSRFEDARRARTALRALTGEPGWEKPLGWVYHHADEAGVIQVVPLMLHAGLPHTGGFAASARPSPRPHKLGASPTPLRRFLHAVSSSKLNRMEELFETEFPPAYRNFIEKWNGGIPRVYGFQTEAPSDEVLDCFLGIGSGSGKDQPHDLMAFLNEYADRLPENLLPIAYDAFGNLILLGLAEENPGVWFWDHELEPEPESHEVENVWRAAPSFEAFLRSFFE